MCRHELANPIMAGVATIDEFEGGRVGFEEVITVLKTSMSKLQRVLVDMSLCFTNSDSTSSANDPLARPSIVVLTDLLRDIAHR
jgi:hypothetical protein